MFDATIERLKYCCLIFEFASKDVLPVHYSCLVRIYRSRVMVPFSVLYPAGVMASL